LTPLSIESQIARHSNLQKGLSLYAFDKKTTVSAAFSQYNF